MHFASLLLLPVLVAAEQASFQDQAQAWFDKAKAYIPGNVPSTSNIPNPIEPIAAKFADLSVEKINIRNWQRKLSPKPDTEEEWMIYMTGGNKTCFGRCDEVDEVWTESVPLLTALPQSAGSPPLHLGFVDCDQESVLCTSWAVTLPSVYHFMVPKKSEPQAKTPLHIKPLNFSETSTTSIVEIPSRSKSTYLKEDEYTGLLHPFDGLLSKFGLQQPFGYVMWGLGVMPSWVMMIGISFVSRQVMSRRMQGGRNGQPPTGPAAPPAQARPAPAAAPAAGGSKKRR
ncbi:PTH2 family peptidyl-tRNA hydrolase [Exophiala viscosa]|uniref:PTH2 family peptidyl-tRNA hydrolase n=1 Tax=Exophiala viscosa TaxID=2486360 RepID=A0AAN6E0K0_9EURO|nr:PTH2 family peptidyl-tRNA hydrolase [Exophiala viscosa]